MTSSPYCGNYSVAQGCWAPILCQFKNPVMARGETLNELSTGGWAQGYVLGREQVIGLFDLSNTARRLMAVSW